MLYNIKKALYIGPRGGKWADSAFTIPWREEKVKAKKKKLVNFSLDIKEKEFIPLENFKSDSRYKIVDKNSFIEKLFKFKIEDMRINRKKIVSSLLKDKSFCDYATSFYAKHSVENALDKTISAVQVTWQDTSADSSTDAIMLQLAAREEFNLNTSSIDHFSKDILKRINNNPNKDKIIDNYRKLLRAQYEVTQKILKDSNIDYLVGIRGYIHKNEFKNDKTLRTIDIKNQPLSSWSVSISTAAYFADNLYRPTTNDGAVFIAKIPKERILGLSCIGLGDSDEYEFITLGSEDKVQVYSWDREIDGSLTDLEIFNDIKRQL
jgi:hypothetical protein